MKPRHVHPQYHRLYRHITRNGGNEVLAHPGAMVNLLLHKFRETSRSQIFRSDIDGILKPGVLMKEWRRLMVSLELLEWTGNRIKGATDTEYTVGAYLRECLDKESVTRREHSKDIAQLQQQLDAHERRLEAIEQNIRAYINEVDPPVTQEKWTASCRTVFIKM
jgi:hypothetical protein